MNLLALDFGELHLCSCLESVLSVNFLFLRNTSTISSVDSLVVGDFYWFDGELISPGNFSVERLFLFGASRYLWLDVFLIADELYFNNSLTFSISHLSLASITVTCFPGANLTLVSPFNDSLLEVKNQLYLTPCCSLSSLIPIESGGIIAVGNDSVIAVYDGLSSTGVVMIFPRGELVLRNSTLYIAESVPDLLRIADLFLHYNWVNSPNTADLSGNHDASEIIIDGPKWQNDSDGGYFEVSSGDILHIPNPPGEFGWVNASISIWLYFNSGTMGVSTGSPCRFTISRTHVMWGSTNRYIPLPLRQWIHLVITFDHSEARVYVDNEYRDSVTPNDGYKCAYSPPSLFPLAERDLGSSTGNRFQGRIRAVQVYTRVLTSAEIKQLYLVNPQGIWGRGHLSLVDSNVEFGSSLVSLGSLSLYSSTLKANNVTFVDLKQLDLQHSKMTLWQNSEVFSQFLSITVNSSELYHDDSINLFTSSVSLIAVNSRFHNDFDIVNFELVDLSYSTLESSSEIEVIVDYFSCFHCQVLGNSLLIIESYCEIDSGNFSSPIVVQEYVTNSFVLGNLQLSNPFVFHSDVVLDDVSVSEFQSSGGSITCRSDVLMRIHVQFFSVSFLSFSDIILSDATLNLEESLVLSNPQILSGSGVIFDNTTNFGQIIPLPLIVFDQNLVLSYSSTVTIRLINDSTSTQVIIGSTVFLDGSLEVLFDPLKYLSGNQYLLIVASNLIGQFSSISGPCSSIFKVSYSSTSVIGSLNEYIPYLNEVAYLSTTGIDDPCCGTFDSPCASFKGVLERMGRKGKVYFHEGCYSFTHGLGNVTDVDWEVIGLGDVVIDGIDDTLLEIFESDFSLSNVDIVCNSANCLSFSDSIFNASNSNIFHTGGASTLFLNLSNLFMNNCQIESTSGSVLNSIDSQVLLVHIAISGNFEDSVLILERSQLEIVFSKLIEIETKTLFLLKHSQIQFHHSFCSDANASLALFDVIESRIIQNDSALETVNSSAIFVVNSSTIDVNLFPLSSTICFSQLIVANNSEVSSINLDLVEIESTSSLFQVSNSKISFQNNAFQSIKCKSLVESVNSLIEVSELVISDVICDTCFDVLGGNIMAAFMDVFQISTTIFGISEVELLYVDHLNIDGSYDETVLHHTYVTAFVLSQSNVSLSNVSLYHLHFDTVFEIVDSYMTINSLSCFDSYSLSLFYASSSVLFLNAINISRSTFTGGFLNAESTNSTLQSVAMYLINGEMDTYTESDGTYLFDLFGGSFVLKNSTFSRLSGNLFVFNKIPSLFQSVEISNFSSFSVFNVIDSVLDLRSLSFHSATFQSNAANLLEFQSFEFQDNSLVNLTHDSQIQIDNVSLTLNSSILVHDDSVEISNSSFEVNSLFDVNSGNFSSSIVVQESVSTSTVSGEVLLSNSFDFFRHVTLDDVSVSEFQFSGGSIICHYDALMRNDVIFTFVSFVHVLNVHLSDSHVLLNQNFDLKEFQILSGSGVIFDNTSNSGQIIPLPLIIFDQNLVLSSSSTITLRLINETTSTQLSIGRFAYLNGLLEVQFDPFQHWSGKQFVLLGCSNLVGYFSSISSPCSSIFNFNYTSSSVLGYFNEYVPHLDHVSYISTIGIDDPCCGSFDSPCASFRGVLERMGRNGTVYFHEGSYSFDQGLGTVTDVDWEVIGLGDVLIEGLGETLFKVLKSNFSISKINVICKSSICFSVANSSFSFNNSDVFHNGGFTFMIESSFVYLTNSIVESNSSSVVNTINSQLVLTNVSISGFDHQYSVTAESSTIEIFETTFSRIETVTLFNLNKSYVFFSFDLFESEFSEFELYLDSILVDSVFVIESSSVTINAISILSTVNFNKLISAKESSIYLDNFILIGTHSSSSIIYVSKSITYSTNVILQDINCKSLIESVNSLIELYDVSIYNVTCDTCFEIFGNSLLVDEMDLYYSSGTVFELSQVDNMNVQCFNIYDSNLPTVIFILNTAFQIADVSVSNSKLEQFLSSKESFGEVQSFVTISSTFSEAFVLSDVDTGFSNFTFSNTSVTRVYHVSNSTISINDFVLGGLLISDSFLSSTDSDVVIDYFYCQNTNLGSSFGLFMITKGSFVVTNLNISHSNGSLFDLDNVQSSLFEQIELHHLQSETVFHFVGTNTSISNITILYSDVGVVFESDNSLIIVDSFNSIGLNSSTTFKVDSSNVCVSNFYSTTSRSRSMLNGSSSVVHLNDSHISNMFASCVVEVIDVSLALNYLKISNSVLTSGIMFMEATNTTFLSVEFQQINENLKYPIDFNIVHLLNVRGGSLFVQNSVFVHIYSNLLLLNSSDVAFQTAQISNFFGSSIFNILDSRLDLSSIILTHPNANVLLTCLHCNGSMDNLLIENSSFTSLFHLEYGSMSFSTTSLTKINTSLVFEIFNSNVTINHLDQDTLRLTKSFLYSELSTVRLSSINITNIRDSSGPLFEFNHSEITAIDLFLSKIECSIFSFSDSAENISELSLSNLNVSFVVVNSNSNLAISNSNFHSIEVQVLVSADNLSNVTIEGSKFSMIYADSLLNCTDSTFSLTLSYFNNLSLQHFLSLTSSSASLSNSSIIEVESAQSLINADDSVITIHLIEVEDIVLETFLL
ncbi:hypothetical protein GEMRC1_008743 [Eukaryota sp. GEM-RC1]